MAYPPPYDPNGQKYPQQGYHAPQPAQPGGSHHTTVYVQQPATIIVPVQQKSTSERAAGFVGGIIGSAVRSSQSAVKSSARIVADVAKETSRELDRHASSPLLECFKPGCGIQIRSKCSRGCIRVLPTGHVDCGGAIGNDYSAHFTVVSRYENKVVLRNVANPAFHLTMASGVVVGTGTGDQASSFRIHETFNHYITFQQSLTGFFLGVDPKGQFVAPTYLTSTKEEIQFEIYLAYSPFGHKYKPTH